MSTFTTNYNLEKPADTDPADNTPLNSNMDTIDTELKSQSDRITTLEGDLTTPYDLTITAANLGISASTNWTISTFSGYAIGPMRFFSIKLTYSGSTLTGDAVSNVGDTTMVTGFPASGTWGNWIPTDEVEAVYHRNGTSDGVVTLNTSGALVLRTLSATGTIASGNAIFFNYAYVAV